LSADREKIFPALDFNEHLPLYSGDAHGLWLKPAD